MTGEFDDRLWLLRTCERSAVDVPSFLRARESWFRCGFEILEGRLRIAGVISDESRGTSGACDDFVDSVCCEKDSVDDTDGSVWVFEFVAGLVEEEVALSVGRNPSATIMALRS